MGMDELEGKFHTEGQSKEKLIQKDETSEKDEKKVPGTFPLTKIIRQESVFFGREEGSGGRLVGSAVIRSASPSPYPTPHPCRENLQCRVLCSLLPGADPVCHSQDPWAGN